jgi:hypothetical protein
MMALFSRLFFLANQYHIGSQSIVPSLEVKAKNQDRGIAESIYGLEPMGWAFKYYPSNTSYQLNGTEIKKPPRLHEVAFICWLFAFTFLL